MAPPSDISKAKAEEEAKKTTQVHTVITQDPVIGHSTYSTWLKLILVTAYVFHFLIKIKGLKSDKKGAPERELSAEEIINSSTFGIEEYRLRPILRSLRSCIMGSQYQRQVVS